MTNFIQNVFSSVFGENVILATILIAMLPLIELKGAIPFAMSSQIFGVHALPLWQAFCFALLGSSLVVPILILIYKPITKWFKSTKLFNKLGNFIENKVNKKKEDIEKKDGKKSKLKRWLGTFVFVAIPLPLTGVWTGTCVAVALGLNFVESLSSVVLGNIIAGVIITLISMAFGDATLIFFYIFIALIVLCLIFFTVRAIVLKKLHTNNNEDK